jgi:predicted RNA binding protein YcfA (HicA-like mRNA interferase family)
MKAREVESKILADGWYRVPSKGHRQYKHPIKPGRVTIAWHQNGNAEIKPKTLKSIEVQAQLKLTP